MLVIMTLEGVLTDPAESVATAQPLAPGVALLGGLVRAQHQVVLLTSAPYTDELRTDLRAKGIGGQVTVMSAPSWVNYDAWRAGRVKEFRSVGWHPELFIDPSPTVCAQVMKDGVTTMVYTAASYARSEWRPDFERAVKPWDEVVAGIEEEQRLRAEHDGVGEVSGATLRGV